MAGKDRGIVGIEFYRDELRAVYVRRHGQRSEVAAAAHMRVPAEAVLDGVVANPPELSISLRMLLDQMGVPPRVDAVVGVPSDGIVVRTLTVPAIANEDLAVIVQGEIEHYRILRTKGSHAFIALEPPVQTQASTPKSVLIVAAEERVTQPLGQLLKSANLNLTALEPVEFGLLRSVAASQPQDHPVFGILVGKSSCDLAAFSKGKLWFYRRLDYGFDQIVLSAPPPPAADRFSEFPTASSKLRPSQKYNEVILESLCKEIGNSIDYVGREYGDSAQFTQVFVSVDDELLADLGPVLSQRLAVEVEVVPPGSGSTANPALTETLHGAEGARYSAAYGLAMRDLATFSGAMPRVDLFATARAFAQTRVVRRNITGSLVTGGIAVFAALAAFLLYNVQVLTLEHQTDTARSHASELQTSASATTQKHQARQKQLDLLSVHGIPAVALMDSVASSLEPGVGIQSMTIGEDKSVTIIADALSQSDMLKTVNRLRSLLILQGTTVQGFTNSSSPSGGLTFTVVAKTLALSDVTVTPAPAVEISPPASSPEADAKPSAGPKSAGLGGTP